MDLGPMGSALRKRTSRNEPKRVSRSQCSDQQQQLYAPRLFDRVWIQPAATRSSSKIAAHSCAACELYVPLRRHENKVFAAGLFAA